MSNVETIIHHHLHDGYQVNSALHPSGVDKSSTSFNWGKGGKVTTAGWRVTLCDPIWYVISRSGVVISITNCYILLTCTYFTVPRNWNAQDCMRQVTSSQEFLDLFIFNQDKFVRHSVTGDDYDHYRSKQRSSHDVTNFPQQLLLLLLLLMTFISHKIAWPIQ